MLIVHCEEGNIDAVRDIAESGQVDINGQATNDLSPLAVAIKHHHIEVAEYLIAQGANVNSLNKVTSPLLPSVDQAIDPIQRKLRQLRGWSEAPPGQRG